MLAPASSVHEVAEFSLAAQTKDLLKSSRAALTTELNSLRSLRCVAAFVDEECPICLAPYPEPRFPTARLRRGAFSCEHAVCHDCCIRLLVVEAEVVSGGRAARCPLCRADGVRVSDAPPWFRALCETEDIVRARQAAKERDEDSAAAAVREATTMAVRNVASLQRLIFGDEVDANVTTDTLRHDIPASPTVLALEAQIEEQAAQLREALMGASAVAVEVSEDMDFDEAYEVQAVDQAFSAPMKQCAFCSWPAQTLKPCQTHGRASVPCSRPQGAQCTNSAS